MPFYEGFFVPLGSWKLEIITMVINFLKQEWESKKKMSEVIKKNLKREIVRLGVWDSNVSWRII